MLMQFIELFIKSTCNINSPFFEKKRDKVLHFLDNGVIFACFIYGIYFSLIGIMLLAYY